MSDVGAVLVAAGGSSRLPGSLPKPFLRLGRSTVLGQAMRSFVMADEVAQLAIVAPAAHLDLARGIARRCRKPCVVVAGGRRRQDSVAAGMASLSASIRLVLVHDAARPLVTLAQVRDVIAAVRTHGAAILATQVVDTLKQVERGRVVATVDRSRYWRAETPQGFRRQWLEQGLQRAQAGGVDVTDDAAAIELLGRVVRVVASRTPNLKVTTAADLAVVRALLRAGASPQ